MDYNHSTIVPVIRTEEVGVQQPLFTIPRFSIESQYTATQALLQLINDLTSASAEIGAMVHREPLTRISQQIAEHLNELAPDSMLIELNFEINQVGSLIEQAARTHGLVNGVYHALRDGLTGQFVPTKDLDIDLYPYPDSLKEHTTSFRQIATPDLATLMNDLYVHTVAECQSVYAQCYRTGYGYGSGIFDQLYIETQLAGSKLGVSNGS